MEHCCDDMQEALNFTCDQHEFPHECPDALVLHSHGTYGLIYHDGGSSIQVIRFCPWCGSELPEEEDTLEREHGLIKDVLKLAPGTEIEVRMYDTVPWVKRQYSHVFRGMIGVKDVNDPQGVVYFKQWRRVK